MRLFFILLVCALPAFAQNDSIRVEALLRSASEASEPLMLHFARQFLGVPYVAHTLEDNPGEQRWW